MLPICNERGPNCTTDLLTRAKGANVAIYLFKLSITSPSLVLPLSELGLGETCYWYIMLYVQI